LHAEQLNDEIDVRPVISLVSLISISDEFRERLNAGRNRINTKVFIVLDVAQAGCTMCS